MNDFTTVPLASLLKNNVNSQSLKEALEGFSCSRNLDVQEFIRTKAEFYERKGHSRTYLVLHNEKLSVGLSGALAAFFTVAITATNYSGVSKSKRAKVLGSTPGRDTFDAFAGILIAQLARDDRFTKNHIDGTSLLRLSENMIDFGRSYLGGRIIYLDAKSELIDLYAKNGYATLSPEPSGEGLYKMFKALPDLG